MRKKIIGSITIILLLGIAFFIIACGILQQENKILKDIFCIYKGSQYLVTNTGEREGNVNSSVFIIDSIKKKKDFEENKVKIFLIDKEGKKQKINSYSVVDIDETREYAFYRLELDFKIDGEIGKVFEYTKLQVDSDTYDVGNIRVEVCKEEKKLAITLSRYFTLEREEEAFIYETAIKNETKEPIEMVALEYNLDCENGKTREKFQKVILSGKRQEFQMMKKFKSNNIVINPKIILKVNGKEGIVYNDAPTITDVQLTKEDIIAYLEGMKE